MKAKLIYSTTEQNVTSVICKKINPWSSVRCTLTHPAYNN